MAKHNNDPLIAWMIDNGVEVTRENYIDLAYLDGQPEWTSVQEELLPEELQDWSKFKRQGNQMIYQKR